MFRNLYLKNPARITLNHYQLTVSLEHETYRFPFDDIQSILIENLRSTISTAAIAALSEHGITVITCDAQHLPIATLLPLQGYYRRLKTLNLQLGLTKRLKDRFTRKLIKQKIFNQAWVATQLTGTEQPTLLRLAKQVQDGDQTSREAVAAKLYFTSLGGKDYTRRQNSLINGALDYGYAVIRSCLARELLQFGFEPALAFNHHSQQNAFNLADDLIEPFRPVIDFYVFTTLPVNSEVKLTTEIKARLLNLLSYEILIGKERQTVQYAIHLIVESLWTACDSKKSTSLLLPQVVALRVHDNGE